MTANEMHAAEGSEPAACSGQRAHNTSPGAAADKRAARNQMDAAEGSGPTASCGRRFHTPSDDEGLGSPDTDRPLSPPRGSGVTPAAVSSLDLAPAVSDGRRGLSREDFIRIAAPLLDEGASWREVGEACGISVRAAQHRATHAGLVSKRKPGRPFGSVNSPETMARIAETLRRRRQEGR